MKIEKWEFAHSPFEKDARRYKVRIRASEKDFQELILTLPINCGRPFVTLSQDYNWAFYVYSLSDAHRAKTVEILKRLSPNGKIVEPFSPINVLDDAAKTPGSQVGSSVPATPSSSVPFLKDFPEGTAPPLNLLSEGAENLTQVQQTRFKEKILSTIINATSLNPNYIFSNFVVGSNNRFTHAAAQAVAENPGDIHNPLFVHSDAGLGKTHLIQAIGHEVMSKKPQSKILYVSTQKFMSQVAEATRIDGLNILHESYLALDLLLVDDVQFLTDSESAQREFFHIFDTLHEIGKQIVLTCDRPPKLLTIIEERLRSRFEWGLITDLKAPNLETRMAILRNKCQLIQLNLEEEWLRTIAEKAKSNVRELEGILKKIHARMNLTHEPANPEFIKNILEEPEPLPQEENKPVIDKVISPPATPLVEESKTAYPVSSAPLKTEEKKEVQEEKKPDVSTEKPIPKKEEPVAMPVFKSLLPSPIPISKDQLKIENAQQVSPSEKTEMPETKPQTEPSPAVPVTKPSDSSLTSETKSPVSAPVPQSLPKTDGTTGSTAEETDSSLRPVETVCYYPKGKEQDFKIVSQRFSDIIKKHKLKIRLVILSSNPYDYENAVNYTSFAEECQSRHCSTSIVLGPPPTPALTVNDFAASLRASMEKNKISSQFIPWSEMNKYRCYLDRALDLSLSAQRTKESTS